MRRSFFDEIRRNKLRSYVLMVAFSLLVILIGYIAGLIFIPEWPYTGMAIAFIIAVVYLAIAWRGGQSMMLSATHARQVRKRDDPYLVNTVEGLALAAGLPKPKVYIIEEESMNAFATGVSPDKAIVAVTSGLRKRMNRQELEGVLAHEMSHIKNFDIRVMLLTTVLLGVVVLLSDIMLRGFIFGAGSNRREGGHPIIFVVAILLAILAPIVAQLMRFAMSRRREYLADASAVQLTRNPSGLASALKRIRDDHDKVVDTANRAMAHLFIENPLRKRGGLTSRLFSTHPDINDRIKRLEAM